MVCELSERASHSDLNNIRKSPPPPQIQCMLAFKASDKVTSDRIPGF